MSVISHIGMLALGFLACLLMVSSMRAHDTIDACRAQHPGHDCVLGWVQGEAFR